MSDQHHDHEDHDHFTTPKPERAEALLLIRNLKFRAWQWSQRDLIAPYCYDDLAENLDRLHALIDIMSPPQQ